MNQAWQPPFKRFVVNRRKPMATYTLIAITVLVHIADTLTQYFTGYKWLPFWGLKINIAIIAGQWWRFVTPIFLHGDITHIGFNMLALYIWGRHVEALYGRLRFVTIYFLAGILGVAASFAITSAHSLGASGAVFGLFGALLYFRKYDKNLFNLIFGVQVLAFIGISLFYGFTQGNVDNMGHLGGLIGGFLTAWFVGLLSERGLNRRNRIIGATLYGLLLIGLILIGYMHWT